MQPCGSRWTMRRNSHLLLAVEINLLLSGAFPSCDAEFLRALWNQLWVRAGSMAGRGEMPFILSLCQRESRSHIRIPARERAQFGTIALVLSQVSAPHRHQVMGSHSKEKPFQQNSGAGQIPEGCPWHVGKNRLQSWGSCSEASLEPSLPPSSLSLSSGQETKGQQGQEPTGQLGLHI